MSYYDNPRTNIHAQIASERSAIIDLRYAHNRILRRIVRTPVEQLSTDLVNEQLSLVQQIQEKNSVIRNLELELTHFTDSDDEDLEGLLPPEEVEESTNTETTTESKTESTNTESNTETTTETTTESNTETTTESNTETSTESTTESNTETTTG